MQKVPGAQLKLTYTISNPNSSAAPFLLVKQLLFYETIVSSLKSLEKKWSRCLVLITHFVDIRYNTKSSTLVLMTKITLFSKVLYMGVKRSVQKIFNPFLSGICLHINCSFCFCHPIANTSQAFEGLKNFTFRIWGKKQSFSTNRPLAGLAHP